MLETSQANNYGGTMHFFIKLCSLIQQLSTSKQQTESTRRQTLRRLACSNWLPGASVRSGPASSPRTRLGWVVGLSRSAVGVREGRGRDDLTDEIAKKEREGGRPPTQNNVPQRQRHPGAVGRPSTRKVRSETFIFVCFSLVSFSLLLSVVRWTG